MNLKSILSGNCNTNTNKFTFEISLFHVLQKFVWKCCTNSSFWINVAVKSFEAYYYYKYWKITVKEVSTEIADNQFFCNKCNVLMWNVSKNFHVSKQIYLFFKVYHFERMLQHLVTFIKINLISWKQFHRVINVLRTV